MRQPHSSSASSFSHLLSASWSSRVKPAWFVLIGVVTAIAEAGVFALRFLLAQKSEIVIGPYIGSTLVILVTPNRLAALNYSALARMIRVIRTPQPPADTKPTNARIPYFTDSIGRMLPSRISRTFILSDLLCIALQFAGSVMAGDSESKQQSRGHSLIVAGFSLQFIFFALYLLLVLRLFALHVTLRREGAKLELSDRSLYPTRRLNKAFVCILSTIVIITCRNIYRMVQAENSSVPSEKVYTYLFDA